MHKNTHKVKRVDLHDLSPTPNPVSTAGSIPGMILYPEKSSTQIYTLSKRRPQDSAALQQVVTKTQNGMKWNTLLFSGSGSFCKIFNLGSGILKIEDFRV